MLLFPYSVTLFARHSTWLPPFPFAPCFPSGLAHPVSGPPDIGSRLLSRVFSSQPPVLFRILCISMRIGPYPPVPLCFFVSFTPLSRSLLGILMLLPGHALSVFMRASVYPPVIHSLLGD